MHAHVYVYTCLYRCIMVVSGKAVLGACDVPLHGGQELQAYEPRGRAHFLLQIDLIEPDFIFEYLVPFFVSAFMLPEYPPGKQICYLQGWFLMA